MIRIKAVTLQDIKTFIQLSIITATRNRPKLLAENALPGIRQQTCSDFEWIVINDGGNLATCNLIAEAKLPCSVRYQEMPHPDLGFGLCHARNLGLSLASGNLVAYLESYLLKSMAAIGQE